jgi:NADH:ubiquinone oxidoreductase subunit 2 (subunit N)
MLTVLVLSLAGVPPLSGYWAKFFIFMAGYKAGATWLVAIGVVMTIVSLYYYLGFLRAMWMNEPKSLDPVVVPFNDIDPGVDRTFAAYAFSEPAPYTAQIVGADGAVLASWPQ